MRLLPALLALATSALIAADVPAGFTSLFNGKDLAGWHGYNPHSVAKLTGEKKDAMLKKMREDFSQHWSVKDGVIYNGGTGPYATTDQEYGDFELNKRMSAQGLKRMFLHAWRLQFVHPQLGKPQTLQADLPPELQQFIDHVQPPPPSV